MHTRTYTCQIWGSIQFDDEYYYKYIILIIVGLSTHTNVVKEMNKTLDIV